MPMNCPERITYTIQPGDTLYRLARIYDTSIQSLRTLNPGLNPTNLRIGQSIAICPGMRYQVDVQPMQAPQHSPGHHEPDYAPAMSGGQWEPPVTPQPMPMPEPIRPAPEHPPEPLPEPQPMPTPEPIRPAPGPNRPSPGLGRPTPGPGRPIPQPLPVPKPMPQPMPTPDDNGIPGGDNLISSEELDLYQDMRTAWYKQVLWMHLFAVSVVGELKDVQTIATELVDSPNEMVGIFAHYYGLEAGKIIDDLFTEQITLGRDYMQAFKAGDVRVAQQISDNWYTHAAQTAQYLASLNPYYHETTLRNMIYDLQDLAKKDLSSRLAGDYKANVEDFNQLTAQARRIADYMAKGLVRQFPNQF